MVKGKDALEKSLLDSPIIKKGDYDYFINPITDGIPLIQKDLLKDVVNRIKNLPLDYNKIVGIEAMGIPLGTALSLETDIPQVIIRKRHYGLEGEVEISQSTGYSKGTLYVNGLRKGDKVLLVDDVLSTGGTISAVIEGVKRTRAEIGGVVVVFDKSRGDVKKDIESKLNVNIICLVKMDIIEGKVVIVDEKV